MELTKTGESFYARDWPMILQVGFGKKRFAREEEMSTSANFI